MITKINIDFCINLWYNVDNYQQKEEISRLKASKKLNAKKKR